MKKFILLSLVVIVFSCVGYKLLTGTKSPAARNVLAAGVTPLPTATATNTSTPYPTLTPLPTIDYRATDQAHQLIMEQERNRMIEIQLAHDEKMMDKQIELASIGATQTFAPTAIALTNADMTLTSGKLTAVSVQATSTAEAPALILDILDANNQVKHAEENRLKANIAWTLGMVFIAVVIVFLIWKMRTVQAADVIPEEDNPEDYEPVHAEVVSYNPRRMEQRFAQVLLAMREMAPNDEAVNLLETFWIERGKRDKFQSRAEFIDVRNDWEENGIIQRRDPTVTNSTFYVCKWDEVQLIANGERL